MRSGSGHHLLVHGIQTQVDDHDDDQHASRVRSLAWQAVRTAKKPPRTTDPSGAGRTRPQDDVILVRHAERVVCQRAKHLAGGQWPDSERLRALAEPVIRMTSVSCREDRFYRSGLRTISRVILSECSRTRGAKDLIGARRRCLPRRLVLEARTQRCRSVRRTPGPGRRATRIPACTAPLLLGAVAVELGIDGCGHGVDVEAATQKGVDLARLIERLGQDVRVVHVQGLELRPVLE
jgi:hypothetical protein